MSEKFRSPHQPDAWSSAPAPPQSTGGNAELDNLEEDLLVQTVELVEQVQKQLADLNRREQALNAQTGQLEQDSLATSYKASTRPLTVKTATTIETLTPRTPYPGGDESG